MLKQSMTIMTQLRANTLCRESSLQRGVERDDKWIRQHLKQCRHIL